jgi:probable HAF family extracellular repeat protein
LEAVPDAGAAFTGWSGACSGTGPCQLTVSSDLSLTAAFSQKSPPPGSRRLTVVLNGSGRVVSAPAGIDCGATCSSDFAAGTAVAVVATPAPGWKFSGWSGDCAGAGQCAVALATDVAVTATFERIRISLAVRKSGSGTVRSSPAGIDCGQTCSATFDSGTTVALIAQPDAGWRFTGWSDGCSGSGDCNLTLAADTAVTASFVLQYRLSLTMSGAGRGSVSLDGRKCEGSCDGLYDPGTTVSASAAALDGSIFMGWTGACSGLGDCALRLDQDVAFGAIFWPFPAYTVTAFGNLFTSLGGIDDGGNIVFVRPPEKIMVGDLAFYRDARTGEERQIWPGSDAWTVRISPSGRIALTTFHWNGNDDAWDSYRMTTSGTWQRVRTLGGADGANAGSIDDAGVIFGGAHVSGTGSQRVFHGYLEDGSRIVDLGSSDVNSGVSARGGDYILGGVWNNAFAPHRAAVWGPDGIHELGNFGGTYSLAYGINRHGVVVGTAERSDHAFHAFIWDPQKSLLRDVGAGELISINDDGVAVGSTEGGYPMPRGNGIMYFNGIVWDLNNLVQEKNTHLEGAMFINSRGQIIGGGFVQNDWRDYILTPRN